MSALTAAAEAAPPAAEARRACELAAAAAGLQGLSCTISKSGEVPSAPVFITNLEQGRVACTKEKIFVYSYLSLLMLTVELTSKDTV